MLSIIIEQTFAPSHWCSQYLKGINAEAKRKNIEFALTDLESIKECEDGSSIAILIGTSVPWLYEAVRVLRQKKIRPVILSAAIRQDLGSNVSYVTMDYDDAMEKLMRYLDSIGKSRAALFALTPDSSTDQNKRTAFLNRGVCSEDDVYYFNATLEDVCRKLYDNIDRYNTVICANQISRIALTKFLREQNISTDEDIHIAAFGDLETEKDRHGNYTLIKIKAIEAGRLAIRCVRLLYGHTDLSGVSLNVRCDIVKSDGTVLCDDEMQNQNPSSEIKIPRSKPTHIRDALMIERILCSCDNVDIEILKGIISKESYPKIAARAHISENTIGYRLKRLMQVAETQSKDEMIKAILPYLT